VIPTANPMQLAYLTTEYPKVSHTFIRREIIELERRGHAVQRLAIRGSGGAVADSADRDEAAKTFVCLAQPKLAMLGSMLWVVFTRPLLMLKSLCMAASMASRSERGLLKHLAYLVEASILLRNVLQARTEHLHVHFGTNSTAVARLMRGLGGPPFSFTVHGPDEFDAPRSFALPEKIADAAFVIAISDFCAAQLQRWATPSEWKKIHIVRCTVGAEFFAALPPAPDSQTLLCVGRLTAQKGQFVLLEALKRLTGEGVQAKLVLAGDGELRHQLETRIRELNLEGQVKITGWIDEKTVRNYLSDARVLVQPSFAEGLPVVIMESLAMERPVISTFVAGIPELVRPEVTGWLVPAGNLDELVMAIRTALAASPEHLRRLGHAGRQIVRERHYTVTEVDKLERLFREAIASAGGR